MTAKKTAPKPRRPKKTASGRSACKVDRCDQRMYERGLCAVHWATHRDLADPLPPDPPAQTGSPVSPLKVAADPDANETSHLR